MADQAGNTSAQLITFTNDVVGPVLQSISITTGGTIAGRLEAGDTISFVYNEALDPASIPATVTVAEDRHGGSNLEISSGIITGDSVAINNSYLGGNNSRATTTATVSLTNGGKTIVLLSVRSRSSKVR